MVLSGPDKFPVSIRNDAQHAQVIIMVLDETRGKDGVMWGFNAGFQQSDISSSLTRP